MDSYNFSDKLQKKVKDAASISSAYQLYPEQISSDLERQNPSFDHDKDYAIDEKSSQEADCSDKEQSSQSEVYVIDGQQQEQVREYLLQKKNNKNKKATQKNESCPKAKKTRRSRKSKENGGGQFPEMEKNKKKKKNGAINNQNPQQSKSNQKYIKNSYQPITTKTSYQVSTIEKIPEIYVPLNFSLILIKEKLTGNEQFLEEYPNKISIERKASQNMEPTALENSDVEEHYIEVQNENSIKNTVKKRQNLRSFRKEISSQKLQSENLKANIIQNQDKMKRLDQIGLNLFQKKEVKSMIEEFMLENIEALAKNVQILITASHQRSRKQSQEQQKQFSAPRKRVKLIRQNNEAEQRDNQIQIVAQVPQSIIKNPFQNNTAKKITKRNARETRRTEQNIKKTTFDKQKVLLMIDEKVNLIQRANPKLQMEESFKKAIVAESFKLLHEIGITGALAEEIIVQWIKRKSKKQREKYTNKERISIKS